MPLLILSVIVQIGLILHVVRTGRPMYWVFIILMAPGIGSLASYWRAVVMMKRLSTMKNL